MTDNNDYINNDPSPEKDTQDISPCTSLIEVQEKTHQLIQQARHEILIDSYQLDHNLYSHTYMAESIKNFCLGSSRANIKILLHDNNKIRTHGHHLITVLQRFSSAIEVRLPQDDNFQEILIIDQTALMQLSTPNSYDARYSLHHRPEAHHLQQKFKTRWNQATRDSRLLSMSI